jgi:pilus assembly protein Flp/PilA
LKNLKEVEQKMKTILNFLKDESGASAAEYGLLIALLAVVVIIGVTSLGTKLNTDFTNLAAKL